MKIFVNNIELDFKLEDENTLRQIIESVQKWLHKEGYFIQAISVDGNGLELESAEGWNDTDISGINRLDFSSVNGIEIRLQYLHTLHQFFSLLQRSLEEKNLPLLKEIIGDYQKVREYLNIIFPPATGSGSATLADKINGFLSDSGVLSAEAIPDDTENLTLLISNLVKIISELIREITSPLNEILNTAELLKKIVPEMEEISVLLQTGKDKVAMDTIIRFTEFSQKLIRIYPFLKAQGILNTDDAQIMELPFDAFYKDFNKILLDLTKAFGANDSVLIGDLLEYEIAPRLEGLINFLHNLNKEES